MKTIKIYKYGTLADGKTIYDFKDIPQGYIKIHGQFLNNDNEAISKAASIARSTDFNFKIVQK